MHILFSQKHSSLAQRLEPLALSAKHSDYRRRPCCLACESFWSNKYALFIFLFLVPLSIFAYNSPGRPNGYVNDFAGVLSSGEKAAIETKLKDFQKNSEDELAVVTIKSLGADTIENYAVSLFKEWGIGSKKNDSGILLLIAANDHLARIEVGYGLEGRLTDIESAAIINDIIKPNFQAGNFFNGINLAVDKVILTLGSDPLADQGAGDLTYSASYNLDLAIRIFIFIIFVIIAIKSKGRLILFGFGSRGRDDGPGGGGFGGFGGGSSGGGGASGSW